MFFAFFVCTVTHSCRLAQSARQLEEPLASHLDDAMQMFESDLQDSERLLGEEHPDTLISRSNLAHAYAAAGRLGEAVPLNESVLEAAGRLLGEEHPDTLSYRADLAAAYRAAGRGEAARRLEDR